MGRSRNILEKLELIKSTSCVIQTSRFKRYEESSETMTPCHIRHGEYRFRPITKRGSSITLWKNNNLYGENRLRGVKKSAEQELLAMETGEYRPWRRERMERLRNATSDLRNVAAWFKI